MVIMIKLPNLDDQNYDDIVETARRRVMQYFPEWTNFNPSDPGVTVLELFAWLKEMQQYHLNRITSSGVISCLRLLGLSPNRARPAKVTAMLRHDGSYSLAVGSPFVNDENLVFETVSPVSSDGASMSGLWIDSGSGPVLLSRTLYDKGLVIEPFGAEEKEGACLYIGFSNPISPQLKLYFEIFDDYPVRRSPFGDILEPSRDIQWTYGPEFDIAHDVYDMTRGFSVSGEISIGTDEKWKASKPAPEMPELFWVCARLMSKGAEESPKIRRIFKDFAALIQRETHCRIKELSPEKGIITLSDHLGLYGEHVLFAAEQGGWRQIPDVSAERSDVCAGIDTGGDDSSVYRVVSVKKGSSVFLSTKTDLPGITLEVLTDGFIEELSLMILDGSIWYDWEYKDDLHTAGPYDRVFTIDRESGSVVFGDNAHGACPPAGYDNILLSLLRVTKGALGNIMPHSLAGIAPGELCPVPDNISPASGGANPETLQQVLSRVSRLLAPGDRLVSRSDYEKSAAATPGTRILKVRALEGYDLKTGSTNIPGRVTVVIQPYSEANMPLPDARLMGRVRRHLEKGRLLGSRIEVAAPEYVPVSVRAEVMVAENSGADDSIRESLNRFLSPTEGVGGIGDPVRLSDVTAVIGKCAGVRRVIGVVLSAPESAASIDRVGNIILPGHAIAYPGEFNINTSASIM